MAVATTHDLPTLRGYWDSGDLTLGKTLGLYPDEVILRGLYQDRELAKQGPAGRAAQIRLPAETRGA